MCKRLVTVLATSVIGGLQEAGDIVVKMIDEEGMSLKTIHNHTDIGFDVLAKLEHVGRKVIHPKLLMAGYPAAKHLLKLPYSEQCRALEDGVEVVTFEEGQEPQKLKMPVETLTPVLAAQAVGKTVAQQRAHWETEKKAAALRNIKPTVAPWKRVRDEIVITVPCNLTQEDLLRMLQELTR